MEIKVFFEEIRILLFIEKQKNHNTNIANISKSLKIPRSTLRYYLDILEKEGLIKCSRVEKGLKGRPTTIYLTKNYKQKILLRNNELIIKLLIQNRSLGL
jgi:predicted ArsR family transcriptional regulator